MSLRSTALGEATNLSTPTGVQSLRELARRRWTVFALNAITYGVLCAAMAQLCAADGFAAIDIALFLCFLLVAPWTVLGFWNAALGLWLVHLRRDALQVVAPYAASGLATTKPGVRTAVVVTVRNEDPSRALARLAAIKRGLDATGCGRAFAYFVLSDTDRTDIAMAEATAVAAWREILGDDALVYRRRPKNTGFKAGNLREFCEAYGRAFEFMLVLDADSFMSGETILRMVRTAEAHPKLGILQSLVVGLPATSPFARFFQFGMRHGMRPYTMGSAWWAGDCGQYWGHNALVRIAPFLDHCDLPILPGGPPLGGRILSHDQIEAALMRRAGFEVRVLPQETGSYEENPPNLMEFTTRDLRWCQGNMQYWQLLGLPGLLPASRFQLFWAILMFLGLPAMNVLILLAALRAFVATVSDRGHIPPGLLLSLYLAMTFLSLFPKLAGFLDIALERGGLSRYGGGARFAVGCAAELVVSFLIGAATSLRTSLFMLGLPFGRSIGWRSQARDAKALSVTSAARLFWPQTLFGLAVLGLLGVGAPSAALWSLPLTLGYVLAIPFAVVSASPSLGQFLARYRICGIPEEFSPLPEMELLHDAAAGPFAQRRLPGAVRPG